MLGGHNLHCKDGPPSRTVSFSFRFASSNLGMERPNSSHTKRADMPIIVPKDQKTIETPTLDVLRSTIAGVTNIPDPIQASNAQRSAPATVELYYVPIVRLRIVHITVAGPNFWESGAPRTSTRSPLEFAPDSRIASATRS